MKRCSRCGEEKPLTEFSWKDKEKGWRKSHCKACVRMKSRAHYASNKTSYAARIRRYKRRKRADRLDFLVRYLETHPCVDCGETDPLVLEFDHLRDKRFNIGGEFLWRTWDEVLTELDKCEVRCANCHRRRTAARGGFRRLVLGTEQ
ncbi:MAG TPA: hypothetical protein VHC63_18885 [Acidimicrobiales bacterium]|nr:hypothetical protein [Acidimicrobiales bacterium]